MINQDRSILLSIVTIAFNNAQGLDQTINSIQSLSGLLKKGEFEQIIVDSSPEVHRHLRVKYSDLTWLRWLDSPADGIYQAINRGTEASCGRVIWHLHAGDSAIDLNEVQIALKELLESDKLFLISDVLLTKDGERMFVHRHSFIFKKNLLGCNFVQHQGTLFKSEIFRRYGSMSLDYRYASDYEFFVRLASVGLEPLFHRNPFASYDTGGRSLHQWKEVAIEVKRASSILKLDFIEKGMALKNRLYHFMRLGVVTPILSSLGLYNILRKIFYRLRN